MVTRFKIPLVLAIAMLFAAQVVPARAAEPPAAKGGASAGVIFDYFPIAWVKYRECRLQSAIN